MRYLHGHPHGRADMGDSKYMEIDRLRRRVEELKRENAALRERLEQRPPVESSRQEVRRLRTEQAL